VNRGLRNEIERVIAAIAPQVVGDRRDFHRFAEVGWTEFRTASLVARRLTDLGLEVLAGRDACCEASRLGLPDEEVLEKHWFRAVQQGGDTQYLESMRGGFTGVIGRLGCGKPTIGLRFDMDALDLEESRSADHRPTQEGFASVNRQACHACGHDGHTAIGLGVARVLSGVGDALSGTVKFIFQPAEEGVRGARSIVEAGHLDDVDYLIGHHLITGWALGEVAPGMGGYAATRKFDVVFTGQAAHAGGAPEGGKNALLAAATAALHLHALPRHHDGFTRVNVGRLDAGTGRNVIPDRALLVCEVRGETTDLCESMYARAAHVVASAASLYGCSAALCPMGQAGTASSDTELADRARKTASDLGDGFRFYDVDRMGGSEDFTEMMARVQSRGGLATCIGIGADLHGIRKEDADRSRALPAHGDRFDFDERALFFAVRLLSCLSADLACPDFLPPTRD
jgi:aminobenzoyl-glutamate utilization protein A